MNNIGKIKPLDAATVQKIAAGEVVERPASVVKELVENALDAKASKVTLEIRNGGKSYIRVTDDGEGIYKADLSNAFKPHSTSKLTQIDDLYSISSFGFRGEALASISSVSKIEVLTKTEDSISGIQAFVEEGQIVQQQLIGCPKGTTMIVRDLFYNLPVRQKFLKSDRVEANKITEIIYRLALGNWGTSFKYIKDNEIILNTSKGNTLKDNIYMLLGKEFINGLIEVNYEHENFKIYGYISNNQFYRGNRSHQYLYVNNRSVHNHNITTIVEEQYKGLIPINRYPIYILFIDIDPKLIDVNIHPTKEEIKFVNENEFNKALNRLIRESLKENMEIPKGIVSSKLGQREKEEKTLPLLYKEVSKNTSTDRGKAEQRKKAQTILERDEKTPEYRERVLETISLYDINNSIHNNRKEKDNLVEWNKKKDGTDSETNLGDNYKNVFKRLKFIGVIFSTYIMAEDTLESRVFIIDQHAAHERILYENYKTQYSSNKVAVQQLLSPEIIELNNLETSKVLDNIETFHKMGFAIEEFGNNSIIVRGIPSLFQEFQLKSYFFNIVDKIESLSEQNHIAVIDRLIKMACSNAIKAGDKIFHLEAQALFKQLSEIDNPLTCPHGRPTIIEITKKDIEKEFKRII